MTLMTPYSFPHHGYRSFARAQDDVLPPSSLRQTNPLLMFRMTPNGNHMLRLLTHSLQLTANGLQLTAITLLPAAPVI